MKLVFFASLLSLLHQGEKADWLARKQDNKEINILGANDTIINHFFCGLHVLDS
jgi:hypothetical protein